MADAMEIVPNEGIPALTPLSDVAPVVHMPGVGDGQNWPSASEEREARQRRTARRRQRGCGRWWRQRDVGGLSEIASCASCALMAS